MELVGLANTRISTDYAHKFPRSLYVPEQNVGGRNKN